MVSGRRFSMKRHYGKRLLLGLLLFGVLSTNVQAEMNSDIEKMKFLLKRMMKMSPLDIKMYK